MNKNQMLVSSLNACQKRGVKASGREWSAKAEGGWHLLCLRT